MFFAPYSGKICERLQKIRKVVGQLKHSEAMVNGTAKIIEITTTVQRYDSSTRVELDKLDTHGRQVHS